MTSCFADILNNHGADAFCVHRPYLLAIKIEIMKMFFYEKWVSIKVSFKFFTNCFLLFLLIFFKYRVRFKAHFNKLLAAILKNHSRHFITSGKWSGHLGFCKLISKKNSCTKNMHWNNSIKNLPCMGYLNPAPCILQENLCSAFWQQESLAARSLDLLMSRPAKSPGRSCPTPSNRDEMNCEREISLSLCPSSEGSSFWKTPVLNGGGQIFSELYRVPVLWSN